MVTAFKSENVRHIRWTINQVNDTGSSPELPEVEQSPCRSIFPPWPWPSVIRDTSHRYRQQDHDGAEGGYI